MTRYQKAEKHLNLIGCRAIAHNHGVSIVARNEDSSKNHWVDISEDEVTNHSNAYDAAYGGYATLKDIVAWADRRPESEIIHLSLEELIEEYNKAMRSYKVIEDSL